jgi:hypothetical protein
MISFDCQLGHIGQIIPGNHFVLNQPWFEAHLDIEKLQNMYNGYINKQTYNSMLKWWDLVIHKESMAYYDGALEP